MLLEHLGSFRAGRKIRKDRDHFFAAVLDRPIGNDSRLLTEGEAGAHVVGRPLGHDRGPRYHHYRRDFSFGDNRRHRHRGRRSSGAQ